MTDELGREMTPAERIAVATGQTTIMDILHEVAQEQDKARDAEIHTVMPSGTVITRGELWREMHRPQPRAGALPPLAHHQFSSPSFRW